MKTAKPQNSNTCCIYCSFLVCSSHSAACATTFASPKKLISSPTQNINRRSVANFAQHAARSTWESAESGEKNERERNLRKDQRILIEKIFVSDFSLHRVVGVLRRESKKLVRISLGRREKRIDFYFRPVRCVFCGVLGKKILCNSDLIGVQSSTASDKWIMHTGNCVPCNQVQWERSWLVDNKLENSHTTQI